MKIIPIHPFNTDDRGFGCEIDQERTGKQIIVFSKPGAVRGRHYHKGISPTKNPEIIILLSGTCVFNWRKWDETAIQTAIVEAPARIEIPPYTWHELIFKTESALLEMNSLAEHAADTFYD